MRRNCGEVWGKLNTRMTNHAIRDVTGDSMGLGVDQGLGETEKLRLESSVTKRLRVVDD